MRTKMINILNHHLVNIISYKEIEQIVDEILIAILNNEALNENDKVECKFEDTLVKGTIIMRKPLTLAGIEVYGNDELSKYFQNRVATASKIIKRLTGTKPKSKSFELVFEKTD